MNGAEIFGQQPQKQKMSSRDRQPQHEGSRFRPASVMESISVSRSYAVLDSSDAQPNISAVSTDIGGCDPAWHVLPVSQSPLFVPTL